jgi:hypothetical protein
MDVKAATTEPVAFDPGFPIYPDFTKNARLFVISMDQVGSTERQGLQNQSGKASKIVCHQPAEQGALPEALSD